MQLAANTDDQILQEAASAGKLKQIKEEIYRTIGMLDKTGKNTEKYRQLFESMSNTEFEVYIANFLNDDSENFYLEILPYENEPTLREIKKTLDYLGIPLEEHIYYRHDGNSENPLRTRHPVPVGWLHLRRLQQVLSKKNSYSLDIDVRNMKTGQVTGADKIARITDAENYALTVLEADKTLEEMLGPRADNAKKKTQMYKDITNDGYVQLANLQSEPEDSQTLSTIDVFFTGAGIMTDLLTPGLALPRTLKDKKVRQSTSEKYEK